MTDASTVLPVDPERWADLETVFGSRGDAAHCWCQWFKLDRATFEGSSDAQRRSALQQQVAAGAAPGVIAYRDGSPAGWCAVEPRPAYPQLRRSRLLRDHAADPVDDVDLWSVSCFVVCRQFRRQGVAGELLDAAIEHARAGGARTLEAYPVDVERRTGVAAAELYHGSLSLFLARGFEIVRRPSTARAVVRRSLVQEAQ